MGVSPKRVASQQLETRRKGSEFSQPPVGKGPVFPTHKYLDYEKLEKKEIFKEIKSKYLRLQRSLHLEQIFTPSEISPSRTNSLRLQRSLHLELIFTPSEISPSRTNIYAFRVLSIQN